MSDDIIKRLREAIAAGPTPGQWRIRESGRHGTSVDGVFNVGVAWCGTNTTVSMEGSHSISSSEAMANASLIAAASPDNIAALLDRLDAAKNARPLAEWHEDLGPVTWWKFPVDEPAWIGSPTDSDWPGYHTHWTPHPVVPERSEK